MDGIGLFGQRVDHCSPVSLAQSINNHLAHHTSTQDAATVERDRVPARGMLWPILLQLWHYTGHRYLLLPRGVWDSACGQLNLLGELRS